MKNEIINLIKQICVIPAPSRNERKKAEFICEWLKQHGAKNIKIDKLNNVIYEHGERDKPKIVFIAHIDTVYSIDTPLEIYEDDEIIKCPGVCDNSANVAGLMMAINKLIQEKIQFKDYNLTFVFSSCEEALGNSDGCRHFMNTNENIKEVIVVDGPYDFVLDNAVGSQRWEVSLTTKGGHSFDAFGNPNAIHIMSKLINDFYNIEIPKIKGTKTTLNVGTFSGGSAVTAIANFASIKCEYRSDNYECLCFMRQKFEEIIKKYKQCECEIQTKLIGERPCSHGVDLNEQKILVERISKIWKDVLGREVESRSGSTDGSIPLSMGIATSSVSVYFGKGNHSAKEETLYKNSLEQGFDILIKVILSYL